MVGFGMWLIILAGEYASIHEKTISRFRTFGILASQSPAFLLGHGRVSGSKDPRGRGLSKLFWVWDYVWD